jgi:hypothetical protein
LAAYTEVTSKWSSLSSAGSAVQDYVNSVFNTSQFVQQTQAAQNSFIQSLSTAATAATTSAGAFTAQVAAYNALSPNDKLLVQPALSGLSGDQWVALTTARAGLANVLDQAQASAVLTGGGDNFQTNSSYVRQALNLANQFGSGNLSPSQLVSLTHQANEFLSPNNSFQAVNVTLSDEAQSFLETANPTPDNTAQDAVRPYGPRLDTTI